MKNLLFTFGISLVFISCEKITQKLRETYPLAHKNNFLVKLKDSLLTQIPDNRPLYESFFKERNEKDTLSIFVKKFKQQVDTLLKINLLADSIASTCQAELPYDTLKNSLILSKLFASMQNTNTMMTDLSKNSPKTINIEKELALSQE